MPISAKRHRRPRLATALNLAGAAALCLAVIGQPQAGFAKSSGGGGHAGAAHAGAAHAGAAHAGAAHAGAAHAGGVHLGAAISGGGHAGGGHATGSLGAALHASRGGHASADWDHGGWGRFAGGGDYDRDHHHRGFLGALGIGLAVLSSLSAAHR